MSKPPQSAIDSASAPRFRRPDPAMLTADTADCPRAKSSPSPTGETPDGRDAARPAGFPQGGELVAVEGWASTFRVVHNDQPAAIVNPNASPVELVGWACGQLSQVNMMLRVIGCSKTDSEFDPNEIAGLVRHFTEQVETMLEVACDRLNEEQRA